MKLDPSGVHLTYCLNVHPGEHWADQRRAIETTVLFLKQKLSPDAPFGLGLRLSAEAAEELSTPSALNAFRRFLQEQDLYVFTVNAFPYGSFHGAVIKENVYRPDWSVPERLHYTCCVANLLAALLPGGVTGSISTVPIAYRADAPAPADQAIAHLIDAAKHLHRLHEKSGRFIQLALEPEPDCTLESTEDCLAFFERLPSDPILRRHLGICFDTCHLAVEFEELTDSLHRLRAAGILIPKLQISAALRTTADHADEFRPFCDAVYLHQTRIRRIDHNVTAYRDLPEALDRENPAGSDEWRTHFHVPLYFDRQDSLCATHDQLTPDFFRTALDTGIPHFEIETYTLHVLPEALRPESLEESLLREYQWTLERIPS